MQYALYITLQLLGIMCILFQEVNQKTYFH